MKDFSQPDIARALLARIRETADGLPRIRLMEVCGTHTMAIGGFGLRRLLPRNIELLSGPGCPVCVTPADYIDNAAELALRRNITLLTYGDLIRVPGLKTSLEKARAEGARVRVAVTPEELLQQSGECVFLAVGFETTLAPLAAVFDRLVRENRSNLSFYTSLKTVPRTLELLQSAADLSLDGFLLPGHVSAVIGADAYNGLRLPSAVAGFELLDILKAILDILALLRRRETGVINAYERVVTAEGNPKARSLWSRYFEPCDAPWRGLGRLPGCSLRIRGAFCAFDAEAKYGLPALTPDQPHGCSCGAVLQGRITPAGCPLFAGACTPDNPQGPCMVSSEGSCAAWFKYERN